MIKEVIMSSTHVDKDGERMSLEALKSMAKQTNDKVIPVGIEHDPRIPPQGRVISAEIRKLDDGHHVLVGSFELFEEGNLNYIEIAENREIPVPNYEMNQLEIIGDKNFRNDYDQSQIEDLRKILGTRSKIREELKKSIDPITILTIGGSFMLGAIATGFLKQIGVDGYKLLKEKLPNLITKKNEEQIFKFDTVLVEDEHKLNIVVLIENPSVTSIQNFFNAGIHELDIISLKYYNSKDSFKKVVMIYKNNKLEVKFGISKSGIPIYPK